MVGGALVKQCTGKTWERFARVRWYSCRFHFLEYVDSRCSVSKEDGQWMIFKRVRAVRMRPTIPAENVPFVEDVRHFTGRVSGRPTVSLSFAFTFPIQDDVQGKILIQLLS